MNVNNGADTDNDGRAFPHLSPREQDAAAVALLAAQGRQLLTEITPVLSRLLELVPGAGAPTKLLDAVPQIVLKFYPVNARRQWTPAELPSILQAFASLARHAQQLDAFPLLKTQFWMDVVQSRMAHSSTRNVQKQEFWRPTFPAYVVDFGGYQHARVMDSEFEDALVAFMTTPVSLSPAMSTISIGFVFRRCRLRVATLEVLERFLDRTFANPHREFNVRMLELSEDDLMPQDLYVLARIVVKCVYQYGIQELRLNELVPAYVGGFRADWLPPTETPATWLAITRTVFVIDALPALESRSVVTTSSSSTLRRVSLSGNYACLAFFATRFSALRYRCSLEEDVTTYVQTRTQCDLQYKDYWRWLAFGFFYPRPRRFAARLRLRKIGHVRHCPMSVAVFTKTLCNPAAELIFGGSRSDLEPTTELLVCSIKAGARVDVFQTGHHVTPTWSDTFPTACELEAIYERADGTVCVVAPGVGLGWVQSEWIDRIEREPLSRARSEQNGLFAGDLGWVTQWRTDGNGKWDVKSLGASLQAMVKLIGHQFHALSLGHNVYPRGLVPLVLMHCTGLTELVLSGQKLPHDETDALLEALKGPLGARLEVLNLQYFGTQSCALFDRLMTILGDATKLPVLRELRFGGCYLKLGHLEALHSVLRANARLELLEVHTGYDSRKSWRTQESIESCKRALNAVFHGQPVSRQSILAFLSVVARGDGAVQALDAWLIRNIVGFASERDLRRTLIWNEEIHPAEDSDEDPWP